MKTIESPTKPAILARLRNSRGFSLIEMAIVLVIIGIIIAAIIKGQDLMVNSRAKQLVSTANAWKIATFGYMDRNGKFPGANALGEIDSTTPDGGAIASIQSSMPQAPKNPVVIGGQSFYFYFGGADATQNVWRNVIVVCSSALCTNLLSIEDVEMMKALDTAMDGSSDAKAGLVRAIKVTGGITAGGDNTGSAKIPYASIEGTKTEWLSTDHYGAVWAFDKPF
jgi:prepilin-type N-terminal cleavage/methylation domain-containing protein